MSDKEILKQKNPQLAEFIEQWQAKYDKTFDLTTKEGQAIFYEGILEMARHMAIDLKSVTLKIDVCNEGVSGLNVHGEF